MKIRSDFVTNSSSTAFILIKKTQLTREGIRQLMGLESDSPLSPIAEVLYERLDQYGKPIDEYLTDWSERRSKSVDVLGHLTTNFSDVVASKVKAAKAAGFEVEMGHLSSDVDDIESFLCCESFELEDNNYYLNAVSCTW